MDIESGTARSPVEFVQPGMAVVDSLGERVGTVELIHMGDPEASTATAYPTSEGPRQAVVEPERASTATSPPLRRLPISSKFPPMYTVRPSEPTARASTSGGIPVPQTVPRQRSFGLQGKKVRVRGSTAATPWRATPPALVKRPPR